MGFNREGGFSGFNGFNGFNGCNGCNGCNGGNGGNGCNGKGAAQELNISSAVEKSFRQTRTPCVRKYLKNDTARYRLCISANREITILL